MGIKEGKARAKTFWFFQNKKLPFLVIGVITFLLYARVTGFEYIGFDDTLLIVENQAFLRDLSNIPQAFQQDVFHIPKHTGSRTYYRPLLTLTLMLDMQLGKTDPKIYHLTNLIFHTLACLLLLQFFYLLKMRLETAFSLTLVFAVHPILSQAVGWIPGRNDSLIALFLLPSLICFLRGIESLKASYILLHFIFFMLALFTKESAILLPFFSLYYLSFVNKKKLVSKQKLLLISGYLGIIVFWFVLRKVALSESRADLTLARLSSIMIVNLPLLLQYLSKIIIPYKLSTVSVAKDTNYMLGFAAVIFIFMEVVLSRHKRWNIITLGGLWFLLFLLPTFLVPVLTGSGHRVYIPLIGLLILISEFDFVKNLYFNKKTIPLVVTLISFLIAINVTHTPSFKNRFNFWKTAAEASPSASLAHLNYGAALAGKGDYDKALDAYQECVKINSREPMIHNNLAVVYAIKKRHIEAEREFKEEMRINPSYADAYYNLGMLYKTTGRIKEAIRMWQEALTLDPDHQRAINELAKYYKK